VVEPRPGFILEDEDEDDEVWSRPPTLEKLRCAAQSDARGEDVDEEETTRADVRPRCHHRWPLVAITFAGALREPLRIPTALSADAFAPHPPGA
jgi:hypothetical protein